MKHSIFSYLLLLGLLASMAACSDVDLPGEPNPAPASGIAVSANGREVTLTWQLPGQAGIENVLVYRNGELIATLPATATSYTIARETPGNDVAYTVKVKYGDGTVSHGVTVRADVVSTEKIVMLLAEPLDQVADDDELAAAQWFKSAYGDNGLVISPAELGSVNPKDNPVVWVMCDRIGLDLGWQNLPAPLASEQTINALKGYYEAGGNLFLAKFATQLTVPLGILEPQYAPNIFGSGEGGEGTDIWAINCDICLKYDHRDSPLFTGLTVCSQFEWPTFALEGPGWREDHNCMWDFNAFQYTAAGDDNITRVQAQWDCTVLATWGHVVDDAVGGIIDFNPRGTSGRCVANGLSAYEFNEKPSNEYQADINRLTQNTIDYLNR